MELAGHNAVDRAIEDKVIKALLIDSDRSLARTLGEELAAAQGIEVEWVACLSDGIARLTRATYDVVLLNPPEAHVAESIRQLNPTAPGVPVILLSTAEHGALADDAIESGAADYLVKSALSATALRRSIRYAIDRRAAAEELIQARDSALQSARLRSEFLGNMSHEIRTPLNGIVGMTRLLLDTRLSQEQREMLDIARRSSDRLVKIVADILDFAKLSTGGVSLETRAFELGAAVESVVALHAEQAQRKGLDLAAYVDADVPPVVRGDTGRLCQVLMSLVGNAVKFTPAGEVTLRVGLVREDDADLTLRFAIKDSGVGIPLQGQRHLFQAFSRAEPGATRQFGGTGLSLAICAELVDLMGGNIGVESATGEGSLFWFTAKLGRAPSATATPRDDQADIVLAGMKVLVSDQSPAAARLVQEHAHAWGIQCVAATNVAAAMAALKTAAAAGQPYDVALIEIQDRAPGDLTLARAIKADLGLARTGVLGMYAIGMRPDERHTRAAGVRALLAKPIRQTQLFNLLSMLRQTTSAAATRLPEEDAGQRRRGRGIASILPPERRARTRILLVEDSPVTQRVQMRILERIGFTADMVSNGQEALAALEQHPYDIILMDCQMPGLDGYKATREIRRRETIGHRTVIIGVTAHALNGDREECLAVGMDDYIAKPVPPEDLAATLEKWLIQAEAL